MQSSGGFIIDDLSTVFDFDDPSSRTAVQSNEEHNSSSSHHGDVTDSIATPKPLTSKQEAKLRSFLDGALEEITRGYRKRFDPTSPLHTLASYLGEWMRLLGVLAHVPPYGSGSTNLLVSYLLRCSTDLSDGITGYSLAMEAMALKRQRKRQRQQQDSGSKKRPGSDVQDAGQEPGQDHESEDADSDSDEEDERQHQIASRTKQLNLALQTLDFLDRIWAAVLRGNIINLPVALGNARKAFPDSSDADTAVIQSSTNDYLQSRRPHLAPAMHSTSSLVPSPAIDGRFISNASASSSTSPRESLPIHGGRGNKTVGVTDQVRLRNIAISSRDKLFAWMRSELDAPAPPTMQEDEPEQDEPPDNTLDGALDIKQRIGTVIEQDEDEDDPEFEDVDVGGGKVGMEENFDAAEDTEEHKHYQDLFDKKLDPDADDDDDGDDDEPSGLQNRFQKEVDSDQTLGASVLGTVETVTSNDPNGKRKHDDDLDFAPQGDEPRADGLPSKRRRTASADANEDEETNANNADANVKMSRSELGSINFSLSDSIGQWDVAFTRLFSRTLRTLSDLSDFAKRGDRTDLTSSLAGISGADEQEPADDRR
ncbi:hypothetical protein EX895_000496 [Sporisorium graminicola]|uniref:Uncharacterized protein n=1 Tax=Sporisorium graminicola TaxID=280036 RepID=A0A4U7L3L6_9BASI|nr:hypothetical protein EX895_000496 [Sporisorium graminicola]TKY90498.1 hypothetical protein EX895_000496 [Sporisorium graminicola]